MAPGERSLADVLQDIIRDVQEIVRSEVRLAKTELREEVAKAKVAAGLLAAAVITAVFAVFFVLLAVVYALMLVMASWAAALLVGVGLAVLATVVAMAGVSRLKQVQATPARAVDSMKENVEWVKQQTK
jgi:uncharacterized membrane protein YqjE